MNQRHPPRRVAIYCTFTLAVLCGLTQPHAVGETIPVALDSVADELGAKVGFYLHDLQTDTIMTRDADFRFPLNSTFKLFACAALLAHVETGNSDLQKPIDLTTTELVSWSPAIQQALDAGTHQVSLDRLCGMMLSVSDNTAANLVLGEIGGPAGFTAFMRSIGDRITRLDRWEPALNEGTPNDQRDTTTPRAIAQSLREVLLGSHLTSTSKQRLKTWLADHAVADDLFRAALPADWYIEDRTGAGGFGTRSIVAVIYPDQRQPLVIALYMRDTDASLQRRNAAIARIGAAIVASVTKP